jgi:hypothetical protein
MATVPAVVPVMVTEHFLLLRVQVLDDSETVPVPDWYHVTLPPGE